MHSISRQGKSSFHQTDLRDRNCGHDCSPVQCIGTNVNKFDVIYDCDVDIIGIEANYLWTRYFPTVFSYCVLLCFLMVVRRCKKLPPKLSLTWKFNYLPCE